MVDFCARIRPQYDGIAFVRIRPGRLQIESAQDYLSVPTFQGRVSSPYVNYCTDRLSCPEFVELPWSIVGILGNLRKPRWVSEPLRECITYRALDSDRILS